MTTTPQEPWASALVNARFVDPRYADEDRPSLSRLAEAAKLHPTTVSKMVRGVGRAKVENVAAVAAALNVDVREVFRWVKQARSQAEPYQMPAEVDLLTEREQEAISELIRAMAAGRREAGEEHERSAPTSAVEEDPEVPSPDDIMSSGSTPDPPPPSATPEPDDEPEPEDPSE